MPDRHLPSTIHRCTTFEFTLDPCQNGFEVVENVFITEPNHANLKRFDELLAPGIILHRVRRFVYRSIEFDYQPPFGTIEVDDKGTDTVLSPKLAAM